MTTKVCSKCNLSLDFSNFSPASGGKYLRSECKKCNRILASQRKELREKYGYPEKNYRCPICLKEENELKGIGGKASTWVVDHDHKTNKFRGHLCHQCNRGIGIFGDDISKLRRAIEYLTVK